MGCARPQEGSQGPCPVSKAYVKLPIGKCPSATTARKDHINRRISHSDSKAQYKRDARNHDLQAPNV